MARIRIIGTALGVVVGIDEGDTAEGAVLTAPALLEENPQTGDLNLSFLHAFDKIHFSSQAILYEVESSHICKLYESHLEIRLRSGKGADLSLKP